MRIAFFVNTFPELSQTFILSQIASLINKNHEVDIFARKEGMKDYKFSQVTGLNHNYILNFYGRPRIGSNKNKISKRLDFAFNLLGAAKKNPLTLLILLKTTRFGKTIKSFNKFNNILSLLNGKRLHYDIIHCHFGPNGNTAAVLKEIGFLKGKIITTFHGYDMTSYISSKGDDAYELLFKVGDLFLPVSERWKNALVALGCSEDKIKVHRMGVELDRVKNRPKRRDAATVNLLTVARLVEKKGICYGIMAVAEVLKRHPDVKYRIIGDGPLRDTLKKLITELGTDDKIELLGGKSHEEVFALLNQTDIFISPSVTDEKGDQEGIPVTLMEAMAHGLPVLSTWHSGIPELVKDGVHGFLVPERAVDALKEKLAYLVANPEIRVKMGDAGRNFVVDNYNNRQLNENLVVIYESLIRKDMISSKRVDFS